MLTKYTRGMIMRSTEKTIKEREVNHRSRKPLGSNYLKQERRGKTGNDEEIDASISGVTSVSNEQSTTWPGPSAKHLSVFMPAMRPQAKLIVMITYSITV